MTHDTPLFRRASLGTIKPNAGQPAPATGAPMHQAPLPWVQALTSHVAIAGGLPLD